MLTTEVLILVVWLCGTLLVSERRSVYVTSSYPGRSLGRAPAAPQKPASN